MRPRALQRPLFLLSIGLSLALLVSAVSPPSGPVAPAGASSPSAPPAPSSAATPAGAVPTPQTLPFRLSAVAPEPILRQGQLERPSLTRRFTLEPQAVQKSQESGSLEPLRPELERIYEALEARVPRDARFVLEGDTWTARGQTGWSVDRVATEKRLLEALKGQRNTVQVALRLTAPARSVGWLFEKGLRFHVAGGQSSFAGSPDFRVHNIRVGSSKLDGVLLERGQAFDFNRSVGRISRARGFVPGYVIAGGTLALEDGGGICQVSTTVFRAAYTAGLRMLERHAHSHQVSYYDPPGFEATVYAPSKNLRFANDTAGPLLMQARWDLERQTLRFDLFGAAPDRTVTVAEPQISGRTLARPPSYLPDRTLEPGEMKRIDMPASGMRVKIVRQIVDASGTARWDSVSSAYRPWGGVFAVHPSDARLRGQ